MYTSRDTVSRKLAHVKGRTLLEIILYVRDVICDELFFSFLDRQKTSCRHSEGSQLLSKSISVGAIQTPIDIRKQLVQSFIQLRLVFIRLCTQ